MGGPYVPPCPAVDPVLSYSDGSSEGHSASLSSVTYVPEEPSSVTDVLPKIVGNSGMLCS